jgi:hypothetical protein
VVDIPPGTLRLFPDHDPGDLAPGEDASLLISRLLEDGDSADLAWLARTVPEPALAGWLGRRGARRLSLRSRAFWEVLLGVPAGGAMSETDAEAEAVRKAIWPL